MPSNVLCSLHRALDISCTQYITIEVKIGLKCPPKKYYWIMWFEKGVINHTTEYYLVLKENELLINKR